ncbi:MAG: hypothetical protein ACK5KM_10785 [Hyphomicrobiaceae bacterium]
MVSTGHGTTDPSILRTLMVFAASYIFALVVLYVVAMLVGLLSSAAASVGAMLAAGAQAGLGDAKRINAPASGRRLVMLITSSFFVAAVFSFAIYLLMPMLHGASVLTVELMFWDLLWWLGSLPSGALATVLAVFIVPNVFMLWFAYSPITRWLWRQRSQV